MTQKNLEAVGWALFFIWIGIAMLADIGFAIGLFGVGIITLGSQTARKYFNFKVEGFWVIAGLLFVLGGIWKLLKIEFDLLPILLIVAGLVFIISVIRVKK
jgi:hypothetical protein